jgi:hypothetical protein
LDWKRLHERSTVQYKDSGPKRPLDEVSGICIQPSKNPTPLESNTLRFMPHGKAVHSLKNQANGAPCGIKLDAV